LLAILDTKEEWSESRKSAALVRVQSVLLNTGQCHEMYASQDSQLTHTVQKSLDFLRSLE